MTNDVPGRIGRPPRSEVRDSPREAAPTEAGQRKVRRRRGTVDKFFVPPELIPEGMTWEWKRQENIGQQDRAHMANLVANGWEAVDASRAGDLAPPGATGPFMQDGMLLMERPQYLSDEAREEELQAAIGRTRELERQMGVADVGQLPRFSPKGKPVNKSWENAPRISVPD